eukprot:g1872.t1
MKNTEVSNSTDKKEKERKSVVAEYSPKSLWKGISTNPWTPKVAEAPEGAEKKSACGKRNIDEKLEQERIKCEEKYLERQHFIERTCGEQSDVGGYIRLATKLTAYEKSANVLKDLICEKSTHAADAVEGQTQEEKTAFLLKAKNRVEETWSKMEGMLDNIAGPSPTVVPGAQQTNNEHQISMTTAETIPEQANKRQRLAHSLVQRNRENVPPHPNKSVFSPSTAKCRNGAKMLLMLSGRIPSIDEGVARHHLAANNHVPSIKFLSQQDRRGIKRSKTAGEPHTPRASRPMCRCKKSGCLKLYCECFSHNLMCDIACVCKDCGNNMNSLERRQQVVRRILRRNPKAFRPKAEASPNSGRVRVKRGCNCTKTRCLKKYCDCFNNKVRCTDVCGCIDCENGKGPSLGRASARMDPASRPFLAFGGVMPAFHVSRVPRASPINIGRPSLGANGIFASAAPKDGR